jgi:dTMP kinase
MEVQSALARLDREMDRMEAEGIEFLEHVRQGFLAEASRCLNRFVVIDANRDVDEIQSDIRRVVAPLLDP